MEYAGHSMMYDAITTLYASVVVPAVECSCRLRDKPQTDSAACLIDIRAYVAALVIIKRSCNANILSMSAEIVGYFPSETGWTLIILTLGLSNAMTVENQTFTARWLTFSYTCI